MLLGQQAVEVSLQEADDERAGAEIAELAQWAIKSSLAAHPVEGQGDNDQAGEPDPEMKLLLSGAVDDALQQAEQQRQPTRAQLASWEAVSLQERADEAVSYAHTVAAGVVPGDEHLASADTLPHDQYLAEVSEEEYRSVLEMWSQRAGRGWWARHVVTRVCKVGVARETDGRKMDSRAGSSPPASASYLPIIRLKFRLTVHLTRSPTGGTRQPGRMWCGHCLLSRPKTLGSKRSSTLPQRSKWKPSSPTVAAAGLNRTKPPIPRIRTITGGGGALRASRILPKPLTRLSTLFGQTPPSQSPTILDVPRAL
jgi:hypothetical protein